MLNIILAALPALGSLVSGGKADAVISAGTKIAREVFGTTDEVSIAKQIETNPALAEQFKARLEAETANLAAQLADVQDARATTVRLAESGSAISWGAPVVSVIVVVGYLGLVFALLFKTIPDNQVTLVLFGGLSAAFAQVINYWLGSSAGSANKDVALKQIAAGKR
jgi:hypothetical protein